MGGISSKDSVRFERRNSRRQSQKNIFHSILNQTKDISNKMNESNDPLTQEEYIDYKRTLENATKKLNNLGGQLKSKNANTYKQACQFVNDTFVYLETRMAKNIVPSDPPLLRTNSNIMEPASPNEGRRLVEAIVERSSVSTDSYQRDSLSSIGSQVTLKQIIIRSELPNIQEEREVAQPIYRNSTENLHTAVHEEEKTPPENLSPMEEIQAVRRNVDELNWQIKNFQGSKYDDDYTTIMCALDENEVILQNINSFGDEIIRQEKKNVYIFLQQCMNSLESKCGQFKMYSHANESEDELPPPPNYPAPTLNGTFTYNEADQEPNQTDSRPNLHRYSSGDEETYITKDMPLTPGITQSQQPNGQYKRKVIITQV